MSGIASLPQEPSGPAGNRRRRLVVMFTILAFVAVLALAAFAVVRVIDSDPDPTPGGLGTPEPPAATEPAEESKGPPDADPCKTVPAKLVRSVVPGAVPIRTPPRTFMAYCLWVGSVPGEPTRYRSLRVQFRPFYAKGPKEALEEVKRDSLQRGATTPSVGGQVPGAFEVVRPGSLISQAFAVTALGDEETVEVRIHGSEMVPGKHGTFLRRGENPKSLVRKAWAVAGGVQKLDQDSMDPDATPGPSRYKPAGKLPADICTTVSKARVGALIGERNELLAGPDAEDGGYCTWRTKVGVKRGAVEGELGIDVKRTDDDPSAHTRLSTLIDSAAGLGDFTTVTRNRPLDDLGDPGGSYLLTGTGRLDAAATSDRGASVVILRRANLTLTVKYWARKSSGELFVPGTPLPPAETEKAVLGVAKEVLGSL